MSLDLYCIIVYYKKTTYEVMIISLLEKQVMIQDLAKELGKTLTGPDVQTVVDSLTATLSGYEVTRVADPSSDTDTEDMMDAFLSAKQIEGRSPKTIERYRYILSRAFTEIDVPIRQITVFHLRKYLADQKMRGISDNTLEGIRNVFSSFFNWLQKERLLPENPCVNLGKIKCPKKVMLPFSTIDIERLKEHCGSLRNRAILHFLLATGCRISEVCGLNRDSIDFSRLECVVFGKGAKERTVFFDEVTAMIVKKYLSERTDDSEALFVGKGSSRMTPGGIRFMLNQIGERAGVQNVHPHRFRRTMATSLINHGMAIQEVASILGHDNINTTLTYVYIDKINVGNNYRKTA